LVVNVRLHTTLQRRTGGRAARVLAMELPEGATLAGLLAQLGLPVGNSEILLVVNGRTADAGQGLAEGDEVHLIPALSGG
jgi:molybdopterin converting factor small subunit